MESIRVMESLEEYQVPQINLFLVFNKFYNPLIMHPSLSNKRLNIHVHQLKN